MHMLHIYMTHIIHILYIYHTYTIHILYIYIYIYISCKYYTYVTYVTHIYNIYFPMFWGMAYCLKWWNVVADTPKKGWYWWRTCCRQLVGGSISPFPWLRVTSLVPMDHTISAGRKTFGNSIHGTSSNLLGWFSQL